MTRLEAMRAISYAIHDTTHVLFIPAAGPTLGETSMSLDNQGAPELVLPRKPEPTFVSLEGAPVLMTKNARGELTVPLSAGHQRLVVQHRQPVATLPLVLARIDVPRVPVPATYTNVELRYPQHWLPLWQSFATRSQLWLPEPASMAVFLLFALWLERVLALLAMRTRTRIAAALLLAFASMLVPAVLWIVVLGCAFVTAVWAASPRAHPSMARILTAITAALVLVVIAGVYTVAKNAGSSDGEYTSASRAVTEPVATDTAVVSTTEPEAPNAAAPPPRADARLSYQGLPAKFELPSGAGTSSFHEHMLSPDHPQMITLVLLSMTLVTWTSVALALVAAWMIWRERAALRTALRTRMAAAMPPPAAEVA